MKPRSVQQVSRGTGGTAPSSGRRRSADRRRGIVLPMMLLILILLGLLAASFAFEMHADVSSTHAVAYRLQTRLAAEAGLQYVTLMLRGPGRLDVNRWYDNEEELHRIVLWQSGDEPSTFGVGSETDTETRPTYRFSIVADDPLDDEVESRYGITDEAAKLNINSATPEQLRTLIAQVAPADAVVDELVDALIDWRDSDENAQPNGAERDYYLTLTPPYFPKNAPFDTVEELLMVKGFTAQVLYGEDFDRNGLLSPNEDDGEETFPLDDGDGQLNKGLFPFITTRSRDFNTANDNKPRIPLKTLGPEELATRLEEYFTPEEIEYIQAALSVEGDQRLTGLVDLLRPHMIDSRAVRSPFTPEDFGRVLDRLTLDNRPELPGLIDVNTAPPEVLRCIPQLPEAAVLEIVNRRSSLSSEAKSTVAWLLANQIVDENTFEQILPYVTARGLQFTVESLGYADHVGTVTRLQAIVEMRGPVAQIVYYRDLTTLGTGFPIRLETKQGDQKSAAASG